MYLFFQIFRLLLPVYFIPNMVSVISSHSLLVSQFMPVLCSHNQPNPIPEPVITLLCIYTPGLHSVFVRSSLYLLSGPKLFSSLVLCNVHITGRVFVVLSFFPPIEITFYYYCDCLLSALGSYRCSKHNKKLFLNPFHVLNS